MKKTLIEQINESWGFEKDGKAICLEVRSKTLVEGCIKHPDGRVFLCQLNIQIWDTLDKILTEVLNQYQTAIKNDQ